MIARQLPYMPLNGCGAVDNEAIKELYVKGLWSCPACKNKRKRGSGWPSSGGGGEQGRGTQGGNAPGCRVAGPSASCTVRGHRRRACEAGAATCANWLTAEAAGTANRPASSRTQGAHMRRALRGHRCKLHKREAVDFAWGACAAGFFPEYVCTSPIPMQFKQHLSAPPAALPSQAVLPPPQGCRHTVVH